MQIDTPLYSKIERGERKAKEEQVIMIAKALDADLKELMTLWLFSKIYEMIKNKEQAIEAL